MGIWSKFAKGTLIGTGTIAATILATPIVWAGYTLGSWGTAATKFAFRHKNLVATGLLLAGGLTYYSCAYRGAISSGLRELREGTIAQVYELRTSALERSLRDLDAKATTQRETLEHLLDASQTTIAALTADKEAYEQALRTSAAEKERLVSESAAYRAQIIPSNIQTHPTKHEPTQLAVQQEEGNVYYYVKQGDTLISIAQAISGDGDAYRRIATHNAISDPRSLMTGQLLKIPEALCARAIPGLYDRAPQLESIVLPGTQKISDVFPENWREVLRINNALGLRYTDTFSLANGSRIVYYAAPP